MDKISVHEYSPKHKEEWDDFVDRSNNGTMFHKQAFLDYHPRGRFPFQHLMFRQGDELIGVLPGGLKNDGREYWSPMGASYGSVVMLDSPFRQSMGILDALMDYSRDMNYQDIYLIPPPIIYNKVYNQHFEYAMLYKRFDFEHSYISHAIPLDRGNYFDKFDAQARRMIRQGLRNPKIRVEESQDYEGFFPILVENKARHGVKPTHSLEELNRLRELLPDNMKLFMIYYDDQPVAGSLQFLANSEVSLCFYVMLRYEFSHLKPVFLAMNEVTRWSTENGYKWMDYGVSQDTAAEDPMTPAMSLIYFKERFHCRGIMRSTFHYRFGK